MGRPTEDEWLEMYLDVDAEKHCRDSNVLEHEETRTGNGQSITQTCVWTVKHKLEVYQDATYT
jgi:hypothetical protein